MYTEAFDANGLHPIHTDGAVVTYCACGRDAHLREETFVENGHTYYLAPPEVAARYRRGGDLFDPADLEKP